MKQHKSIQELQQEYYSAKENDLRLQAEVEIILDELRNAAKKGYRTVHVQTGTVDFSTITYLEKVGFEVTPCEGRRNTYFISFPV